MDWRSHAMIGTLLAGLILYYLIHASLELSVILSIFAGFSALLPDIDHKMSKIRSITDQAFVIFAIIYSYTSCTLCSILEIVKVFLSLAGIYFLAITFMKPKHRGITHSLFFVFLYAAVLYVFFGLNLSIAGFIGYFSHLLADKEIKII